MDGLDVLGAIPFEEYLVGATVPDEKPTLSKLAKAAQNANAAAAKLSKLKGSKAAQAAQKLRAHASTATSKGKKLSAAMQKARTKAQSALASPKARPAVAAAATRAAAMAAHPSAAVARAVPSASAAPMTMRAPRSAPGTRAAAIPARRGVSVLGFNPAIMAAATDWVKPMLDVYIAFSNAVDDATLAGEIMAKVQPLVDQLLSTNPNSPLVPGGNDILVQASVLIDSVQYPPDPMDASGGTVPGANVGWGPMNWALVGDISDAGYSLQKQAIDWIKQARIATGQYGNAPAAVAVAPAPAPVPGVPPITPVMPPMNQDSGGGGGGSGGGNGGGGGGSSEGGGEEGAPPSEGGEEDYATQGAGAGVPGVTDAYSDSEEEYTDDDSGEGDEGGEEEASDEEGMTVFDALEASLLDEEVGHGGGGHGGGGHGGHGHGGFRGGSRGMRGGWGGWYGAPWYDGYGYDVLLEDDEELADKIAKKVAQKQWATGTHVGAYDIQSAQRQMNTLRDVPVSIARAMVKHGKQVAIETIALAQGSMFQRELPGVTSLKNTLGHVQWHENNLQQFGDPTVIYPNSTDLKKWVMQSFIDANSVEEGRATQEVIWNAMWTEIGEELAKMPPKIFQAIVKLPGQALEAVTGIPSWVWWVGGSVLVVGVGFGIWKIITLATPAVAGVAARRYLP